MSNKLAGGIKANSTSVSLPILLRKAADGTEQTGKLAADMTAYYWRQGGTPTALTTLSDLATITTAWTAGGVKEADAVHQPGLYRLDVDDDAFATGADWVVISVLVSGDFVFYEKYPLETQGAAEVWTLLGTPAGASIADDLAEIEAETDDIATVASDTTTLLARLTNARSSYLDNLNVGGNVASSAEVTSIQNNTRCVRVVPNVIERPDSGTVTYRIELLLYDETGSMEAPDSAPTLALVNQSGTDLASRLDSTTMSLVSTGRYRSVYTASVGDPLEQLVWAFSVVEGGATRIYGNTSVIVDTTAVDFTSSDRSNLAAIKAATDNLPSDPADASDIAGSFTTVNTTLGTIASYIDTEVAAIKAKTDNLPTSPAAVGSAMTLADGAITAAKIADGTITDAKIAFPAEAAGRPSTFLAAVRRVWEWVTNKRTRNRSTGDVTLFGADNTTVLETQTQSTTGSTDTQTKGA